MNKNKKNTAAACERLHNGEKGFKAAGNIDFLLFLIGLVIAMFCVRAFVLEPVRVDGPSMMNTLQDGERCIVEKVSYWFTKPKQGDIVIIHFPDRENESFIKRVIATAGQTVEVCSEVVTDPITNIMSTQYYVLVDGVRLDESAYADTMLIDEGWPYPAIHCDGSSEGVFTVPEDCIFVMGDHRTNSTDSRMIGAITLHDVVGRVHGVMYPFKSARNVD